MLMGPPAPHLWSLVHAAGPMQKIVQAANWIRQHFAAEMRVDKLTETMNMNPTAFRQHFRAITSMSPMHFQKLLRLQDRSVLMRGPSPDTVPDHCRERHRT